MDLDRDGQRDILSGSYSRMENDMAGLFQVLHGKADGTFRKAEVLQGTDGQPLIIPHDEKTWTESICTRPFAIDWDGDGKLDLVVGNFVGTFHVFKGDGTGKFQPKPEPIQAGGEPLRVAGYHGDPFVVDWDGDGDLDILSGSAQGGVQWAENRAGRGKPPAMEPFQPLIPHGPESEYGQILRNEDIKGPLGNTRIWVDDINGDGKLDILVGDNAPLISPANGISAEEFKKRFADWRTRLSEASQKVNTAAGDPKTQQEERQRYQKVYDSQNEFMKEDSTGFVWLYIQK